MSTDNGAIGWDDEVSASDADENQQQDEFVVLPKGTYPCTVMKIERGSFKGSSKLPPCNKVKVGIIIDGRMTHCDTLDNICDGQSLEDRFFDIYKTQKGGEE